MDSRTTFRRSDQWVLVVAAACMQGLYMLFPLLIECDATMFLSYARYIGGVDGGHLTANRPPGFPAFLAATALPFDSFAVTMAAHAAIGVLIPLLIYRSVAPFNRAVGLGAAAVNIWSTLPFSAAKQLLADQFFVFLLVCGIYALSRLYWTRSDRYVYAALLIGFAAWLTRWEGLIPLIAALGVVATLQRPWKAHWRPIIASLAIGLVVAAGWSVIRSRTLNDPRLIGSVANGNGRQLLHRTYLFLPGQVMDWERARGTLQAGRTSDLIVSFFPEPRPYYGVRIVKPENGPASMRLRRLIEEVVRDPATYRQMKPSLDGAYQDPNYPKVDYYWHVFGRFEGRPAELADNFFNQPNNFILDFLWDRFNERIGLAETDALFRQVALEGLVRQPLALMITVRDVLTFAGFELRGFVIGGTKVLPLEVRANYYATPFNIAGCAKDHLTPNMWDEYVWDREITDIEGVRTLMAYGDYYGRNLVRLILGTLFLSTLWFLPWSRHRAFFLFFPVVALGIMVVTAMGVGGGAYNRYENPVHPFMLVSVAGVFVMIIDGLRRRKAAVAQPGGPAPTAPR